MLSGYRTERTTIFAGLVPYILRNNFVVQLNNYKNICACHCGVFCEPSYRWYPCTSMHRRSGPSWSRTAEMFTSTKEQQFQKTTFI
jgi:hypothetical protein